MSLLLGIEKVTVDYPGTRAVDNATFEIRAGDVIGIVGANGSGKTTLLSVLCGARRPTAGVLYTTEGSVVLRSPQDALARGFALVPQEPQLAVTLPCWENLLLGQWNAGRVVRSSERKQAVGELRSTLPEIDPDTPAGALRKGDRAMVALAAALRRRPRLLGLDEPTAVLGEQGFSVVERAVANVCGHGGAVVLVSHRMRDIVRLATRVVLLVDGRLTFNDTIKGLSAEDLVSRLTVGRPSHGNGAAPLPRAASAGGASEDVLTATRLRTDNGLQVDELKVRSGEIVGFAGLAGSGRSRLLRVLSGAAPIAAGEVRIRGQLLPGNLRSARRAGIEYIPEDRVAEALLPPLSVTENLTARACVARRGLISLASRGRERALGEELIAEFGVRTPDPHAPVTSLSGGNQQRVVLGRALAEKPLVLIADEPTQGVDSSGRADLHAMLREYATAGGAVLLSISDYEELAEIATRVFPMRDGRLLEEVPREQVDYRTLLGITSGATETADTGR